MGERRDDIWRALGDPRRRRILDLLRRRPHATGELCARFPELSRAAVIKHLGALAEARLVTVREDGRRRWNELNAMPLHDACARWLSPFAERWTTALDRLRTRAEEEEQQREEERPMAKKKPGTRSVTLRRTEITMEIDIAAPPARVFRALTAEIGKWWPTDHMFDGELATGLVLEPWPGGRLYEKWRGKDEGALWANVSEICAPGRLELKGTMGMSGAVYGMIGFDVEARKGGSVLKLSHMAMGDLDPEAGEMVGSGWLELLHVRLRKHVAGGAKAAKKGR